MTVAVVFNPISGAGRARAAAERLREGLARTGIPVDLVPTERADPGGWLRPRLVPTLRAVVVAGGDGAVRMVAPEAAIAGVPLWHAPCGTENLFARAFGMSADPERVAAAIASPVVRRIDLGRANGEPFLLMASAGFDATVVHELARHRKGSITHLSYLRPILRTLARWKASGVVWTIDGEPQELGPGLVVVGNLPEYGLRLNPALEAVPDDGLLDAVHLPVRGAAGLLGWAALLRSGLHLRHPGARMRRGRSIRLVLDPAAEVQCDGDPVLGGPQRTVDLHAEPGAVGVLLPVPDRPRVRVSG